MKEEFKFIPNVDEKELKKRLREQRLGLDDKAIGLETVYQLKRIADSLEQLVAFKRGEGK